MFLLQEYAPNYLPIYVTPLLSVKHPATPGSQTEMYAVAVQPDFPLRLGDAVHLLLLSHPPGGAGELSDGRNRVDVTPLGIRGRISGERERSELEVEFVVSNDNEEANIRRAFLRTRAEQYASATPTTSARDSWLRLPEVSDRSMEGRMDGGARGEDLAGGGGGPCGPLSSEEDRGPIWGTWAVAEGMYPFPGGPAGTGRSARGVQRISDHGRWVVCTSSREEPGLSVGGQTSGDAFAAPGPTRKISAPWLTPNERSRRRDDVGVGLNADRSSEARARAPWGLNQP